MEALSPGRVLVRLAGGHVDYILHDIALDPVRESNALPSRLRDSAHFFAINSVLVLSRSINRFNPKVLGSFADR